MHDISSLKVNDLTLILLTWGKWWANNASKQQMGFNSGFKGLKYSNIYPTRCNVTQFILSGNCSTCFGWYHRPSSGVQTTVSTASGICHTVTATCCSCNCVMLHLFGYILEYSYDARTRERLRILPQSSRVVRCTKNYSKIPPGPLDPCRWSDYNPPKRQEPLSQRHRAISQ